MYKNHTPENIMHALKGLLQHIEDVSLQRYKDHQVNTLTSFLSLCLQKSNTWLPPLPHIKCKSTVVEPFLRKEQLNSLGPFT